MRIVEHSEKMHALVVDDEPLARSNLAVLLHQDPEIGLIIECGSGAEAVTEIKKAKPDVLFIDVQMPELDGFDVLELLGSERPRAVVFVTAYDHYAIRAFEAGALDYLLKPFDDARFHLALERAKERIREHVPGPKISDQLIVKSVGQVCFVRAEEIDWIEAADYYARLHVGSKTHMLRRSMSELERDLDSGTFSRIHRSTIVNLHRVRSLDLTGDGDYEVRLADGTRLGLSRRYRGAFEDRMSARGLVI